MSESDSGDRQGQSPYARPTGDGPVPTPARSYVAEPPAENFAAASRPPASDDTSTRDRGTVTSRTATDPVRPGTDDGPVPSDGEVGPIQPATGGGPVWSAGGADVLAGNPGNPDNADHPGDPANPASSANADNALMTGAVLTASAVDGAAGGSRRPIKVAQARRGPRRARLVIKHIDPWTVMKVSFVVSLVMLAVCVVAVAIIYAVLGKMGVWSQINTLVNEVAPTTTSTALRTPLTGSRVVGLTAAIGGINVVLVTALSTLAAAIYNLIADLVGGIEVTLTDP